MNKDKGRTEAAFRDETLETVQAFSNAAIKHL